jgi:hypothetical protein
MKVKIRQNIYGNWYGYISGRKVEWFFGSTTEQKIAAHKWLEKTNMELDAARLAERRARNPICTCEIPFTGMNQRCKACH